MTLYSLGGYFWNSRYAKEDLRAAARYLQTANTRGEPVVVPVTTGVLKFYDHGPGALIDSYHVPALAGPDAARQFLANRLAGQNSAYIVWSRPWAFDPCGYLAAELSRTGVFLEVFQAPGVKVFHWQRRGGKSG